MEQALKRPRSGPHQHQAIARSSSVPDRSLPWRPRAPAAGLPGSQARAPDRRQAPGSSRGARTSGSASQARPRMYGCRMSASSAAGAASAARRKGSGTNAPASAAARSRDARRSLGAQIRVRAPTLGAAWPPGTGRARMQGCHAHHEPAAAGLHGSDQRTLVRADVRVPAKRCVSHATWHRESPALRKRTFTAAGRPDKSARNGRQAGAAVGEAVRWAPAQQPSVRAPWRALPRPGHTWPPPKRRAAARRPWRRWTLPARRPAPAPPPRPPPRARARAQARSGACAQERAHACGLSGASRRALIGTGAAGPRPCSPGRAPGRTAAAAAAATKDRPVPARRKAAVHARRAATGCCDPTPVPAVWPERLQTLCS